MSTTLSYDFTSSTLEDWMKVVHKDLKEKPYTELTWVADGDIVLEPINTEDGLVNRGEVLSRQQHHWKTAIYVASNFDNEMVLNALENGVDTLILEAFDEVVSYQQLFDGVEVTFLSWMITIKDANQVAMLKDWVDDQEISITFKVVGTEHGKLLLDALRLFPKSSFIIGGDFPSSQYTEHLCAQIVAIDRFLRESTAAGLGQFDDLLSRVCLEAEVSGDFLAELAQLRTIQLIWKNYLKAFQVPAKDAQIVVRFDNKCLTSDRNTNLIQLTIMVMSAVLGGASVIVAGPTESSAAVVDTETLRLSSNIQMMLKMECYFDKVADPYAGSYFVENLTQKLATKVWSALKMNLDA